MLPNFSVKRRYTIVVAVIMVLILGIISFINLQTDLLPSIDLPYVVIATSYPGASPEEIEMIVTRPLEQVLATTSNIKNVSSVSSENSSMVILEFNSDTNMDSATIEINSMLDLIKPSWEDSIGTPMVMRLNPDMLPVMVSAVDVEGLDVIEISRLVEEEIIPEFESIGGVASVSGEGLLEENIEVLINPKKVEELNKEILKTVDTELAEAEEQLLEARQEIEDGKSKLAAEEEKQNTKLSGGERAIADAKRELSSAETQIALGELELKSAKDKMQTSLNELKLVEQDLNKVHGILSVLDEKVIDKNKKEIEKVQEELERLVSVILDRSEYLPETLVQRLEEILETTKQDPLKGFNELKVEVEMGLDQTNNGRAEIEAGLTEISKQEKELLEKKSFIQEQKDELYSKEHDITQGKIILANEMERARAQLEDGEETLNEKIDEFESAKEDAFKQASLDGVLTDEMISGILAAQNFSMPAGYVSEDGTDYLIKVGDKVEDLDEIKNLLLFDTGEDAIGKIYLKDVADISKKDNSEEIYAKVNGNDAVMLVFQKQSTFSTADIAKSIRERTEGLSDKYEGLGITHLMDQGMYIDMVVESVLQNVIYGGILAILILILFLKDLRPTIIIAVSIPISIIFAIAMMYFTGVTINIISLAGLALGVGMLVDNSIVVIENIYRLRQEGKPSAEAAIEGAREVSGAILASTLTTACVFLPIVFVEGLSRQLFTDMGLTIAYSLFASLLVALTLVPAMASGMLKATSQKESKVFDKLIYMYERILRVALNRKGIVMLLVVVLLVASIYGGLLMGTAFIPEMEAPQMSLSIQMPKESTFKDTTQMTDTVIDRIINVEGVETVGAFQGGALGNFGGESVGGGMSLYLLLDEDNPIDNDKIEREIKALTDDLDCTVTVSTSTMDLSALGASGIEILVKGRETDILHEIASDIATMLKRIDGTTEISDGIEENLTEMRIIVNKERAMEEGLTVAQVFSHVSSMLSKGKTATTLSTSDKDYPVIVLDQDRQSIARADLQDLTIETEVNGIDGKEEKQVRIGDIAKVVETQGLSSIRRDSQERYMTVTAGIDTDHNIGVVGREFERQLRDYDIPDGYKIEISGESEMIDKSLQDLSYMLLLAIAFIYLIMVAQFQSLLSPFIVMFTIPLAFTGGLAGLVFTGNEVSLIAMLGFLVLGGVVVNNGIVFVDFANQLRNRGYDIREALVTAGKTRMKPILMTAITTILGLSTLSVGMGMGAEVIQPLAIVIMGGLTYATILTLIVVPVMYAVFHRERTLVKGEE